MERTTDTATAAGLRQHSIGPAFPAVVVGKGVNPTLWYVTLGKHWSGEYWNATEAEQFANLVGDVAREKGYAEAVAVVEEDAEIMIKHNLEAYNEATKVSH